MISFEERLVCSRSLIAVLFIFMLSGCAERASSQKEVNLTHGAVARDRLENGLTVLAKRCPPSNLVTIHFTIGAGSSNEGAYLASGISHFVEHMVFKGTPTRKAGEIEREIRSYGGVINGATSLDLTTFHVSVPSDFFQKTLELLKDMLLNATFDETELSREREVILKEIRLQADEPQGMLTRQLFYAAYLEHPYRYPPIGFEERFNRLTREDLVRYYNATYVPNRMVVAVAGDVDPDIALRAVETVFSSFRASDYTPNETIMEPPQTVERRGAFPAAINLCYFAAAFHSTAILDKDLYALDILSVIMGRGDRSRLNSILVKKEEAAYSVSAWNYTPRSPGLFVITALLDLRYSEAVERLIKQEVAAIQERGVLGDELAAAKRAILADYIFSRETQQGQAADLAENEALTGNYKFSEAYVRGIQSVTINEIRRVARKYLDTGCATVMRLQPDSIAAVASTTPESKASIPTKKIVLPNGVRLILRQDATAPTAYITCVFAGGVSSEPRLKNGISNLTVRMLLKGTRSLKATDMAGAIESRGGFISTFSGLSSFGINCAVLKDDVELALNVLREAITAPIFREEELAREKKIVLSMIKDADDDIFSRGFNAIRELLYYGDPSGMPYLGTQESVMSLNRDDLISFYRTYCVGGNLVISVSGNFDSNRITGRIKKLFSDIPQKASPDPSTPAKQLDEPRTRLISMQREQSLVLLGFKTVPVTSLDRYALEVIRSILSGNSGRLFSHLRDNLALSYVLGVDQKLGVGTGYFLFYVATTKEKIEQVKAALFEEIAVLRAQDVSTDELAMAKRELATTFAMEKQSGGFFALQNALDELYALGYDTLSHYESRISAVTVQDVRRVATDYFDPCQYAEVIISPE